MQNSSSDERERLKLAQIWQITRHQFRFIEKPRSRNCIIINEILKDDFNVNQKFTLDYKFTSNSGSRQEVNIHLKNCTALHFLAHIVEDIDTFITFIARGADYTIKNGNGQTALHLMITQHPIGSIVIMYPCINSVLAAHVESRNFVNPRDNDGISHFHGACMANHVEAAKLFLDNRASIEETVKLDAPQFARWAPLHFAVAFGSFEVAQILVERGADVNAKTAKGEHPLDLLFEIHRTTYHLHDRVHDKEQFVQVLIEKGAISAVGLSTLHIACSLKDLTMAERLLDEGADIEYAVPSKSHICPGHTALHFAAKNGIKAVKMLMKRGAKFNLAIIQNDPKLGPFRVKYSLQMLCDILSCIKNSKELHLSDGQTKLLDLILAMETLDDFRQFLQNETVDFTAIVPTDSVLWPGYTILHLAVTFSSIIGFNAGFNAVHAVQQFDTTIVEECLNRGSSLNVPNLEEQTPIHLAYIQNKKNIARLMLQRLNQLDTVTNLVDQNNLSYLHIACAIQDEALAERLLGPSDPDDHRRSTTKSVPHMEAGSTPLHAAVSSGSRAIAELLLRRGADLHAADASGLTPIHRLHKYIFSGQNEIVGYLMALLSTNVVNRVVEGFGWSYLHIASAFHHTEVVEKLLDLGSNVNDAIVCQEYNPEASLAHRYLSTYASFTPLQLAIHYRHPSYGILDLLLRRGADVFASAPKKLVNQWRWCRAPIENVRVLRRLLLILWEQEDMQKSMEQRLGLTRLHVACCLKNEKTIRSVLADAVDVNVPVRADSLVFAGCTPLHLLLTASVGQNLLHLQNAEVAIGSMIKMLVDRGADVTIANVEKATPIHVFNKFQSHFLDRDLCKDLLLNAHRDFSVNPMNDEGWSHFHLACYWHRVKIVQKFLQHGSVNVNQPLDYFIREMAGCTPLHLALSSPMTEPNADWTKMSQTVDLLLKHGADVAAKDVSGSTPLHTRGALYSPGMSVFGKLVSYGGDIKYENLRGESPIEQLVSINVENGNPPENLAIFRRYGYWINSWNRLTEEGYIAKIFLQSNRGKLSESSEFKKFVESPDARTVDDLGRTAIHNIVAHSEILMNGILDNCRYAIESFMKIGIDIDDRDKSGQTALHYAARMENWTSVVALLLCGADVNIDDNSRESPYNYAIKLLQNKSTSSDSLLDITTTLTLHIQKLQHLKVEVSHFNQNLAIQAQTSFRIRTGECIGNDPFKLSEKILNQVETTKTMDVGTNSLTLYDFLSETAASTLYPLLLKSERDIVDHFFESIDYTELKELVGIVKLQTRKMRARLELLESALSSLRVLLGFSVPGLCEQISRFLLNSDLKNLIATALKARKSKLSEISS